MELHRRGHYGRALEDAIQSQKNEWPRSWEGRSPLSGGKSFNTMDPVERVNLTSDYRGLQSSELTGITFLALTLKSTRAMVSSHL